MKIRPVLRVALFSITLLSAVATLAQTKPAPQPETNVDVVYTGRLLGYFRVPSLQKIADVGGCPSQISTSKAAEIFKEKQKAIGKPAAILVGTGDNFAPQLEARVFSNVPEDREQYPVGNKELYFGSAKEWVFYKDLELDKYEELRTTLQQGRGVIPNDNVGCFLRHAGYAAVVPGKHDFYFGAERLRQFARFLAAPASASGDYHPVQMLGANLVIKTVPIESTPVPDSVIAKHNFQEWPSAYPLLNLKDRGAVYPWFSVIKIQLLKLDPKADVLAQLRTRMNAEQVMKITDLESFVAAPPALEEAQKKKLEELNKNWKAIKDNPVRLCKAKGHPNADPEECREPADLEVRLIDNALVLYAYLPKQFTGGNHFSTLAPGENYLVCTKTIDPKDNKNLTDACARTSVHAPFFYFPHTVPNEKAEGYLDPEPYVVVKNNVAIFGVVDPNLNEQVGILNFGWANDKQKKLTSRVSVEDPADALRQQLDYFEVQYPKFSGLKVLLAQMSPQRARALAARFPDFQIVVSAADDDQATTNVTMATLWKSNSRSAGTFLAVPTPYFDPAVRKGTVHLGVINASRNQREWQLSATALDGTPVDQEEDTAKNFWDRIKKLPDCLLSDFSGKRELEKETYDNKTYLKWLVLCSMQQHTGADVALIQTRDLFDQIPKLDETPADLLTRAKTYDENKVADENLQQMLDRLVWKGDLVTILQVPGSALKKALEQSAVYEAAEKSTLSLSVDNGRKLETLGIRSQGGEYFVNDLPLDDNRLYTLATTDYIGAGDTGYPDLVKAARNPRTHPAAFAGNLVPISGLVCNKLFEHPADARQHCLPLIHSETYLDRTIATQTPPYKPESRLARLWKATGFAWPDKAKAADSVQDAFEQKVQRRTFWAFSLKNLSFGLTDLDNNDTDKSLSNKFGGIALSGLTAKGSRNITLGLDTRLSRFADKQEVFFGVGIDYNRQAIGDPRTLTSVTQNKNRLFSDIGLVLWRRPGRALPNVGAVFSVRGETQLEKPFSSFALNTGNPEDQIRIFQKRSLLLLGRLGMRWQNKSNSFEIGGQFGREMRALRGYRFDIPGRESVECLVEAGRTLAKCIEDNSKPPDGAITLNSTANAMVQGRPRGGMYWTHTLSIPFTSKLKYEVTQDADFFFVNFARSTTVDTRFRYNSKNSVKFMIWSNFSIGPTLDILMFQNHSQFDPVRQRSIGRNFLFQRTLGIETKINFDIFNRREKWSQIVGK